MVCWWQGSAGGGAQAVPPVLKEWEEDTMENIYPLICRQADTMLERLRDPATRAKLIEAMKVCDIEGFLEGTDNVYFSGLPSRFKDLEDSKRYIMELGVGKEKCIEERDFLYDKFFVYTDEKSDRQRFFHLLGSDIDAIDRGGGTYECVQKQYSKATAIAYMQEYLGLDRDEIYVVGDSANDLPMFRYGGHGIAMGDHDPVLDPYTEYVTDKVERDGIRKALLHYGLI